jgi:hypothetical protein
MADVVKILALIIASFHSIGIDKMPDNSGGYFPAVRTIAQNAGGVKRQITHMIN